MKKPAPAARRRILVVLQGPDVRACERAAARDKIPLATWARVQIVRAAEAAGKAGT